MTAAAKTFVGATEEEEVIEAVEEVVPILEVVEADMALTLVTKTAPRLIPWPALETSSEGIKKRPGAGAQRESRGKSASAVTTEEDESIVRKRDNEKSKIIVVFNVGPAEENKEHLERILHFYALEIWILTSRGRCHWNQDRNIPVPTVLSLSQSQMFSESVIPIKRMIRTWGTKGRVSNICQMSRRRESESLQFLFRTAACRIESWFSLPRVPVIYRSVLMALASKFLRGQCNIAATIPASMGKKAVQNIEQ